jgi:hypothetical protein
LRCSFIAFRICLVSCLLSLSAAFLRTIQTLSFQHRLSGLGPLHRLPAGGSKRLLSTFLLPLPTKNLDQYAKESPHSSLIQTADHTVLPPSVRVAVGFKITAF